MMPLHDSALLFWCLIAILFAVCYLFYRVHIKHGMDAWEAACMSLFAGFAGTFLMVCGISAGSSHPGSLPWRFFVLRPTAQQILAHPDQWSDHIIREADHLPPALLSQILLNDVATWHPLIHRAAFPKDVLAKAALANFDQVARATTQQEADAAIRRANECVDKVIPPVFALTLESIQKRDAVAVVALANTKAPATQGAVMTRPYDR